MNFIPISIVSCLYSRIVSAKAESKSTKSYVPLENKETTNTDFAFPSLIQI